MYPKFLTLMRGPSGCGKSTAAQLLDGLVLSTDDYFTASDGTYNFVPAQIHQAHVLNQYRALCAMKFGTRHVIIDNTNIRFVEMFAYVAMGTEFEYTIAFVEPAAPWAFNVEKLSRRTRHGVPVEVLQKMVDSYEKEATVEKVFQSVLQGREHPPILGESPLRRHYREIWDI